MRKENPVLQTGDCHIFSPCEDILAVRRAFEGGKDVFGKERRDAVAITMINRSAKPVQVFLTKEDVQGRTLLISGTGAELFPIGGSFSVRLPGLRGITLLTTETAKA